MLLKDRKRFVLNLALILALLGGLFGVVPVHAATLTVTNTNDSDTGSLRQAIADAVAGDTLTFHTSLAGQTITLASNLIINKNLTIDGSGLSPQVTISGGNIAHLEISNLPFFPVVTISDLSISDGSNNSNGGAIFLTGTLTLIDSTLMNNHVVGDGVVKGTYNLAPNQSQRVSYIGLDAGPVVIQSIGGVPIIASERVAYFNGTAWTSFAEMMGLPKSQLTTTYVFPWYNNVDIDTQLRFGVP